VHSQADTESADLELERKELIADDKGERSELAAIYVSRGLDVETAPLNPRSWMGASFSYWEGPIRFSGSHRGEGYLELTGY
jgi:predicted secreted hydrolase